MANRVTSFLSSLVGAAGPNPAPTKEVGSPGFAFYGGYIVDKNLNAEASGQARWMNFSDIVVNTSIVAAGIRSFFNLIQRTEWTIEPAKDLPDGTSSDAAVEMAEFMEEVIHSMATPWNKIITKTSSFKFNGFSWSEWTARRFHDGRIGLKDIRIRPCHTIERWVISEDGNSVEGVYQRRPNDGNEVYLPRSKSLYLVDDVLTDDPRGTGLLRHCLSPSKRLKEYLRNEGVGIQRDLRGIPIGRAPFGQLDEMVRENKMTAQTRDAMISQMRDLVKIQSKAEDTGVLIDSSPYFSQTETGSTPSPIPKWGVEILTGVGSASSITDTGQAIDRLNREMARILGVEHLMLGDGSGGNRALSEDKSRNFFLQMEGTLSDIAEAANKDIIETVWALNGFDEELMPSLQYEAVQFKDVSKITSSLRDMSVAGAILSPNDPVIDEVRQLLGLSPQSDDILDLALDGGEEEEPMVEDQNEEELPEETVSGE